MTTATTTTARRTDLALVVLRLVIGIVFIAHGSQKLFVYGLDGVAGSFAQLGMPLPGILGPLVAFGEFFAGLGLIVGLLTRVAAAGMALTMVGAIGLVHLDGGFFAPTGIEFQLVLLASTLALALTGAGAWSADGVLAARRGR